MFAFVDFVWFYRMLI